MCGIAGFFDPSLSNSDDYLKRSAHLMSETITHRGPDDGGEWADERMGIALSHRRLSILDLSPAGHQPMVSASGRYVIVYNGEIYNHLDLRNELETHDQPGAWRGHSDTETLLTCIEAYGIKEALKKAIGMFAFALLDLKKRTLYLGRDRLGEKPLYYGWQKGVFLFGSELKALKVHHDFEGKIDRNALALFLRHSSIPAPYTIYKGIHKLLPGTLLELPLSDKYSVTEKLPDPEPYWSLSEAAASGMKNPFSGDDTDAVEILDSLLRDSIRGQMLADVPLGAFLSGGYDSSTVVSLMQSISARPVKTFSIGYHNNEYNEANHAKDVAEHLKTEHTELYVTPEKAMAVIPRLPTLYDEPFSDSSQIPTFLVSEMTRQHVTVSLSGDGGDELFGGYNRYFTAMSLFKKFDWLPKSAQQFLGRILSAAPPGVWNYLGRLGNVSQTSDKARKAIEILLAADLETVYRQLVSHWKNPSEIVLGGSEPLTKLTDPNAWLDFPEFEHRMMYLDSVSYLPDDILVKVDRAAMGVSLETRVPFLDHRVVEFAWKLPLHMKIRNGEGKWILRQVLYKYIPRQMMERPKMGFGVPIDDWLRGPLKDWAENLLGEKRLKEDGLFDPAPIRKKWAEHLTGKRRWHYDLWDVLMFQAWHESQ